MQICAVRLKKKYMQRSKQHSHALKMSYLKLIILKTANCDKNDLKSISPLTNYL